MTRKKNSGEIKRKWGKSSKHIIINNTSVLYRAIQEEKEQVVVWFFI